MEIQSHSYSSASSSSFVSSVVRPMTMSPKSPPHGGFDLCGKRRQMLKVQALEREIGLLEEELKSLEGLQLASKCCQELDTFIEAKPDPFIAKSQDIQKSHYSWKRIWAKCCLNLPWSCCFSGCQIHLGILNCCRSSKFQWPRCSCLKKISCQRCCILLKNSCLPCSCCCFKRYSCKCKKVNLCSCCAKTYCNSCHLCCYC